MTIIALTGWGQEGDRLQSREAGCDGHLVKPVNLADLEKLLAELAGRPQGEAGQEASSPCVRDQLGPPFRRSVTMDSTQEGPVMPLRDHFRSPLADRRSWDGFHGHWPTMIVIGLSRKLPQRYVAEPQVHLGSSIEIDVATYEEDEAGSRQPARVTTVARVATAVWAPPRPTLAVATDLPALDEYEVRVYDTKPGRRLVAAVEIVSPANKDRPEHRRAFVAKCAALLQNRVCVAIVDLVTTRTSNLYSDLMELFGQTDPSLADEPPSLYAVACRWARKGDAGLLETWTHPLALGQPLPTLPLWLAENLAVPLELEPSYEETCRILRIP